MEKTPNNNGQLNRKGLWLGVGIFILALVVRLIYLSEVSKSPTFLAPIVDAGTYDNLARSQAQETSPDFFWHSFFYPFFLSRVYFFSGNSIVFAKLLQIILGSLLCVLVYHLGRKLFNRWTGTLAGVIAALYGPLIFFESELLATGWASIWSVVLLLLFLKACEKKDPRVYFALGICGGLSIITRATFILFFLAASIWLILTLRKTPSRAKMIATAIVGFLLIIGPVSILSFHVTGHFTPLPESGSINLYIGNNPEASKTIMARPGADWEDLKLLPLRYGAKNQKEPERFFMRQFRNYVTTQPLHYIKGLGKKTIQFFSSREIPRSYDIYTYRKYSPLLSIMTWKAHGFGFPFGILLPLAILGLIRCWSRVPMPIILLLILHPSAVILVFVAARYRAPVIPVMIVLAAAGICNAIETMKNRRWGQMAVITALVALVAVLSSIAGPFEPETVDYDAEMHCCLGFDLVRSGRIDDAIYHLSEALKLNPLHSTAHNNLATALCFQEKFEEAIQHFEKTLEINPESNSARINLAYILWQQGRIEEAVVHFKKDLEIYPESATTHYDLACALLDLGETEQAVEHLRKAITYAEESGDIALANKIRNQLPPDKKI
jgi:4-amino-4-deoxy-L-arabinose transferase-like glycosyltransferase